MADAKWTVSFREESGNTGLQHKTITAPSEDEAVAHIRREYLGCKIDYVKKRPGKVGMFNSKLLKKAYGYDTTGMVNEENQTNQRDTEKQKEKVEDSPNPANIGVDSKALTEFPEIRNKPNRVPSRSN